RQIVRFDADHARWTWDLAAALGAPAADDVVDLLVTTLRTLPPDAQRVLLTAACIGNRFDLGVLAGVLAARVDDVARALWPSFGAGVLVPAVEGPRFPWAFGSPVELGGGAAPAYRFVHDRVQQAAYGLLSEEERRSLHLRIGRWLEAHAPDRSVVACAIAD